MARIDSLSILASGGGNDDLAEKYGPVIENLEQETISGQIKNKDLSGDPTTGTVEAKRFENMNSNSYGTARSGGSGQKGKAKPVVVPIDVDRELIEEVEDKDTKLYGVDGYINRKVVNHGKSMKRELERAFFHKAARVATLVTLTPSQTALEDFEELVQKVTGLKNDFIDGIERDMVSVIMTEAKYGAIRTYLDTSTNNANVDSAVKSFGTLHGAKVYSSVYMPDGCDMLAMADGAIAQPVMVSQDETGKIPLSNAYHFGLFYSYGVKDVMPETIFMVATSIINTLSVTTAANGTTATSTDITVDPATAAEGTYKYKLSSSAVDVTLMGTIESLNALSLSSGTATVVSSASKYIVVVEVDSNGKTLRGVCKSPVSS